MKKIIPKIPIMAWLMVAVIIIFLIINSNMFSSMSSSQIKLLSSFFTVIGAFAVAYQIQQKRKSDYLSIEYLNRPIIQFRGHRDNEISNYPDGNEAKPTLCGDKSCNLIHWFDYIQVGNLSAKNLRICLYHDFEDCNINRFKKRWLEVVLAAKDEIRQYGLDKSEIPFDFFSSTGKSCFFIAVEFESPYQSIKYKRLYQLSYLPQDNKTNDDDSWLNSIKFYNLKLIRESDSYSVGGIQNIKNYFRPFFYFLIEYEDRILQDEDWMFRY